MKRFGFLFLLLQFVLAPVCRADFTWFNEYHPKVSGSRHFKVDGMSLTEWCRKNNRDDRTFHSLAQRLAFSSTADAVYLDEKVFETVFDVTITQERQRRNGEYVAVKSGHATRYREDVIVKGKGVKIILSEGEPEAIINGRRVRLRGPAAYISSLSGYFYLPAKWLANQLGGDLVYIEGQSCNLLSGAGARPGFTSSSFSNFPVVRQVWRSGIVSGESTWTYCAFNNARVQRTTEGFMIRFDWQIYNVNNPREIDQIFVAINDRIISTVFDGIPGREPGKSGTFHKNIAVSLEPSQEHMIYVVRTAAPGAGYGINHYQQENGGWRVPIAKIITE